MARSDAYSQHFLRSPRLVAELIGHSNLRRGDTVLDIGAGSGVITSVLARRVRRVVAVEPEPVAARKLRANTARYDNIEVYHGDFMTMPLPNEPYKVFANIPFHLSSPIVARLTSAESRPRAIYLIVQRQFAHKLLANNQHFTSQLGAMIAPWWQARVRKPLRRTDFTPPPAVDTVLLELKPREVPLAALECRAAYRQFVEQCYTNPTFFTALPRARVGINPERNPAGLTAEQWADLYAAHSQKK